MGNVESPNEQESPVEVKTNGSFKVPKTLIVWAIYLAFSAGIVYAAVQGSYSKTDGRMLEVKVQQLEKTDGLLRDELKSINDKLDRLVENSNKK